MAPSDAETEDKTQEEAGLYFRYRKHRLEVSLGKASEATSFQLLKFLAIRQQPSMHGQVASNTDSSSEEASVEGRQVLRLKEKDLAEGSIAA